MWPLFAYQMRRLRGTLLGWTVPLALLAAYLIPFYSRLADQRELLEELVKAYPPEFLAFFGSSDVIQSITDPTSYLHVEFFSYMPLVLGIYALLVGSGLLAGDEEAGRLDMFLSLPVSRTAFFLSRWLAFLGVTGIILAGTWAAMGVAIVLGDFPLSAEKLALAFLSLGSVLFFFGAMALALSQLLPSRRSAAMLSGLILVAGFFVVGLARANADLEPVARLFPLYYYQGAEAVRETRWAWIVGHTAGGLAWSLLGWWRFSRRDLRVSGEGSWPRILPHLAR